MHIDVTKRKAAKKKRTYEVVFTPNLDESFNRPLIKAKRILLNRDSDSG